MKRVYIQHYQVEELKKRIVLLTDIHYHGEKEKAPLEEIYEKLEKMDYDYLCISGDLLDSSVIEEEDWFLSYIAKLGQLSKVMIGIGNHEQTSYGTKREYTFNHSFYQKLKKIKNVKVLDNSTYVDGNIRFIGLTLPLDYYYRYHENKSYFEKYVNHIFPEPYDDKKYNILLCHTPVPFRFENIFEQVSLLRNISLVMCGHMHGAMTPLWMRKYLHGRGLVGPFKTFFPHYSYGQFKQKKTTIVVSSGVTKISNVHTLSFLDWMFSKEISMIEPK